jgi:hypothetical protein
MTTHLSPIPTGLAQRTLGLTSRDQMIKVIDSGLLPVVETTPSGQRRVDSSALLALAARPYAQLPPSGAARDFNAHLRPLQLDSNGLATQRTYAGFHVGAVAQGLTPQQIEDAYAGLWNCNPDPYLGSAFVGDISGFCVALGLITGYTIVNRLVRFTLAPPTPGILARYQNRRIKAKPGAPFQSL